MKCIDFLNEADDLELYDKALKDYIKEPINKFGLMKYKEFKELFVDVGRKYNELNSKKNIDKINSLDDQDKINARDDFTKSIKDLIKSISKEER